MKPLPNLDYAELRTWGQSVVPSAFFWTVSGAHLYGFESTDSDIDLRGCFRAPLRDLIGLREPVSTLQPKIDLNGIPVEAVSHEIGKYLRLLNKHNGYVLEQILSPLVVAGEEFLGRLRPLAKQFITRNCYYHYRGFLKTQRKLYEKESPKKAKTLLYAYRVVFTGIHLLRSGEVQAHLPTLNEIFQKEYIPQFIEQKRAAEFGPLVELDTEFHEQELTRLESELDQAYAESSLPESGPFDELNEFLVSCRLGETR